MNERINLNDDVLIYLLLNHLKDYFTIIQLTRVNKQFYQVITAESFAKSFWKEQFQILFPLRFKWFENNPKKAPKDSWRNIFIAEHGKKTLTGNKNYPKKIKNTIRRFVKQNDIINISKELKNNPIFTNPFCSNEINFLIMDWAVENKNFEILNFIYDQAYNKFRTTKDSHSIDPFQTFLGLTPAHWAACCHKFDDLKKFSNVDNVNSYENSVDLPSSIVAYTTLHYAVRYGFEEGVLFLLGLGANINPRPFIAKFHTPLHLACKYEHNSIVEILLKNGANPTTLYNGGQSKPNKSSLTFACKNPDNLELIEALLKHNALDFEVPAFIDKYFSVTKPLVISEAAKRGNLEVIKILLKYISYSNKQIEDALASAKLPTIKYILLKRKLEISIKKSEANRAAQLNNNDKFTFFGKNTQEELEKFISAGKLLLQHLNQQEPIDQIVKDYPDLFNNQSDLRTIHATFLSLDPKKIWQELDCRNEIENSKK